MGREKGSLAVLWLSLLLLMEGAVMNSSHVDNRSCHPSRCGIITNILYPFRLRDDPPFCGNRSYELVCENNVTFLPLLDYDDDYYYELHNSTYPVVGRYRVLGINYNNFTIRLVDEGIHKGDCSSLPRYSLLLHHIVEPFWERGTEVPVRKSRYIHYRTLYSAYNETGDDVVLFEQVGYVNCSDPVKKDAAYVDMSPCVNRESRGGGGGHLYAVVGNLSADRFQSQCRLKWVTPIASYWEAWVPDGRNGSYADIHTMLSSGFELSWLQTACDDALKCPDGRYCAFSPETQSLQCMYSSWLSGKPLKLVMLLLVEDYIIGVMIGLWKAVNAYEYMVPYYKFEPPSERLMIKLGEFTGRFVLPIIISRFLIGLVFLSVLLIYACRRRHLSIYEDIEDFIKLHNLIPIRYSYNDLKTMTEGFKNKLGEGGFGTVYKGKLRSGPNVAIKMLGKCDKANGQEFMSEVATIGRIHHFNVVHLVGFCVEGTKRALVYEFMSHGSLDKYIFHKEKEALLSYRRIYEISLGVAHGIAYLHHGCDMQILHFDIKPHNILLDDNFTPKISDFGLARLYAVDDSIVTLTAARGTIGYMAPELFYKNIGRVSYKADIYSFGMLLMEMTSQRRNLNPHAEHSSQLYFPLWIYDQFDDNKDIEMEDLTGEEKDLVKKMFIVALWCIQLKPADRPAMNKVIEMLEANDVDSLEMPPKPSLYPNETVLVDASSSSNETASNVPDHSHGSSGEGTSYGN